VTALSEPIERWVDEPLLVFLSDGKLNVGKKDEPPTEPTESMSHPIATARRSIADRKNLPTCDCCPTYSLFVTDYLPPGLLCRWPLNPSQIATYDQRYGMRHLDQTDKDHSENGRCRPRSLSNRCYRWLDWCSIYCPDFFQCDL